jgi:hypothetical protein
VERTSAAVLSPEDNSCVVWVCRTLRLALLVAKSKGIMIPLTSDDALPMSIPK